VTLIDLKSIEAQLLRMPWKLDWKTNKPFGWSINIA
jgi:hypothetical protein